MKVACLSVLAAAWLFATGVRADDDVVAAPVPHVATIVVIDRSASMSSRRLITAIDEIRELARQLPPSPQTPWLLIPFNDEVRDPRRFTAGVKELEAYLDALTAEGGTLIAAGLEHAAALAQDYLDARHLSVLLYTDGEDPNQEALRRQEEALVQIFDQRSERGLTQSVVCRRWGRANAELVASLKQKGNVHVVDAGEARLINVVLHPRVELHNASWVAGDTLALEVTGRAAVQVGSSAGAGALGSLRFRCTAKDATGDLELDVEPQAEAEFTIRLHEPILDQVPEAIELQFDVSSAASVVQDPRGILLATLASDRVSARIDVPPLILRGIIAQSLTQSGPAQWHQPLAGTARVPLRLTLLVREDARFPSEGETVLSIRADGHGRLVQEQKSITLAGPGNYTLDLAAELSFGQQNGSPQPATIKVVTAPEHLPVGVILDPQELDSELTIAPPPRRETRITARATLVSPAVWVRLVDSLAAFQAEIEIDVDGPLGENSRIAMVAPPGVCGLKFEPDLIRRGRQTILMTVVARLATAPQQTTFPFDIQPPEPRGAVQFLAPQPLQLNVAGPQPARATLLRSGRVQRLEAMLRSDATPARITVLPILLGISNPKAARGLRLAASAGKGVRVQSGNPMIPFQRALLVLTPKVESQGSFFRDRVVRATLSIEPMDELPSVIGSTQEIEFRSQAPLKRVVFWAGAAFVALIIVLGIVRYFWQTSQGA